MQLGVVGQLNPARVNGDELHPVNRRLLDPRADYRVAVGRVGADQDRRVGGLDVIEGAGRAGVAKAAPHCERCWRVADARAVVDVVGADGGADQPLHRPAVLVGCARGGEAGDCVGAMVALDPRELGDDPLEGLVPGRFTKAVALADQRRG